MNRQQKLTRIAIRRIDGRRIASRDNTRRAAVLVPMVIFSVMVGLAVAALAIDTGVMFSARSELQSASDSAALAAASAMGDGQATATARATLYAGNNVVANAVVQPGDVSVTFGDWNGLLRQFVPTAGWPTTSPGAVRVDTSRNNLSLFFSSFIGVPSTMAQRGATALGGGGVCLGIWGLQGVSGNGNIVTDSYDSTLGPYAPGNINSNGDICSCQDINLVGSLEIRGDAMYGSGYNLSTRGVPQVWGRTGEVACNPPPYGFDIAAAQASNNNGAIGLTDNGRNPFQGPGANLRLTGHDNLTLAPGTYYFDSVSMAGQATLTITGQTDIYIYIGGSGKFTGGGITNVAQNPRDLTVYSAGNDLDIRGTAGFYGAIIAPSAQVKLVGTSDMYGAILGQTVVLSGTTNVHIDEALVRDIFNMEPFTPILVE